MFEMHRAQTLNCLLQFCKFLFLRKVSLLTKMDNDRNNKEIGCATGDMPVPLDLFAFFVFMLLVYEHSLKSYTSIR
jgi:hypothetical protein